MDGTGNIKQDFISKITPFAVKDGNVRLQRIAD